MTDVASRDETPPRDGFRRPHPALFASELPRAMGELQAFTYALPYLLALPRGDGHRVLVLPGFTGDDRSTAALRWFLRDRGYRATPWRLGRNLGPTDKILEGMDAFVATVAAAGERISIVGWSLGGIFGRELARTFPSAIRGVITLGSPFRLTARHTDQTYASGAYEALSELHSERAGRIPPEDVRPPMPVPVTNIYTRTDGVVPWDSCIERRGDRCENIEVPGSHSGLGHNPFALAVIADRLAQPDGTWKPYQMSGCQCPAVRVGPAVPRSADG
jgi:pimeloyl-ACP methyl ester carboxylesterase